MGGHAHVHDVVFLQIDFSGTPGAFQYDGVVSGGQFIVGVPDLFPEKCLAFVVFPG